MAMGCGDYAGGLKTFACQVAQSRIVDISLQLKYPPKLGTWADEANCYSAYIY